jgi:serine/threonine-protein kinase
MYKAPVPLRDILPLEQMPPGLEAIVLRCLSKKAELRYQSMAELVRDLEKAEHGLPSEAETAIASGNFRAPADYFRVPQKTAVATVMNVPGAESRSWGLYALAGVFVAMTLVGGGVLYAVKRPKAVEPDPSVTVGADPQLLVPTSTGTQGSGQDPRGPAATATSSAQPAGKEINIVVKPVSSATEFHIDGKKVATGRDFHVSVKPNETITVTVALNNYESKQVEITDQAPSPFWVDLVPKHGPTPPPVLTGRPTSTAKASATAAPPPTTASTTAPPPPKCIVGKEIYNTRTGKCETL